MGIHFGEQVVFRSLVKFEVVDESLMKNEDMDLETGGKGTLLCGG